MKKALTLYWTIISLISIFMLFSAYKSGILMATEFTQIGFPEYFRHELTAAKLLGAITLLIPQVPGRVREWVFVGFTIVLVSAIIAKSSTGYPLMEIMQPVFTMLILFFLIFLLYKQNHNFDYPKPHTQA